jgi:hypothetical protein
MCLAAFTCTSLLTNQPLSFSDTANTMLTKFIVVLAALSLATATGINAQTRGLQGGPPGGGGGGGGGGGDDDAGGGGELDYQAISAEIESLIQQNPNRGPTLVRLAWHSSGTYDELTKTGGSDGATIRFPEELFRTENTGLNQIIILLRPVYTKYADAGLSYADLFTLAGGKQSG